VLKFQTPCASIGCAPPYTLKRKGGEQKLTGKNNLAGAAKKKKELSQRASARNYSVSFVPQAN
jgi:hypothetical protein